MTPLQILLWGLIVLPVLLLALVLAAAAYGQISYCKVISFAAAGKCAKCGTVFGRASVLAAIEQDRKRMEELRKQHPNVIFRTISEWEIQCPQCGLKIYFYPDRKRFETNPIFAKAS